MAPKNFRPPHPTKERPNFQETPPPSAPAVHPKPRRALKTPHLTLLLGLLLLTTLQAKPFIGWIPVQHVEAGETTPLDLKRFYEPSPEYKLAPLKNLEGIDIKLNPKSLLLYLTPHPTTQGLLEVPLEILPTHKKNTAPVQATLTLAVKPPQKTTFKYRGDPNNPPTSVALAGSFNGWNPQTVPETTPGEFELRLALNPGTHQYKFLVNEQWTQDPHNPTKTREGNSQIQVPKPPEPPNVFVENQTPEEISFQLVPTKHPITQIVATLQKKDGTSQQIPFQREGNRVTVPTQNIQPPAWIRVVCADKTGQSSNSARAPLHSPKTPFQWQDGILYYTFTDRFVDGDPSNNKPIVDARIPHETNYQGGDFAGIQKKIDEGYFKTLGANILWLAPLNKNPEGGWQEYLPPYRFYAGYHGYWPTSSTQVEPRFGGENSLQSLITRAHQNDLKIIADLVLKHVHVDHPLYTKKPKWFGRVNLPDGTKNLRRWNDHPFDTWFEETLPGFNFNNPQAVDFLLKNAQYWAKKYNLDGYRLDAVKHINYSFWPAFRTAMRELQKKEQKDMYFVGETFMDRQGIMSFVGPNMLDGQFDFPLYDTIIPVFAQQTQGFEDLEKSLRASELTYGKETLMSPLVGNHDKPRFMAYADGDLPNPTIPDEEEVGWKTPPTVDNPETYEYLKLATAFILSIDGVPMLYYGDEIGLTGAGDPDNRRMMPKESELTPPQKKLRNHIAQVAHARLKHPALRYGNRRALHARGNQYAFVRRHLDDSALCVWNRAKKPATLQLKPSPEMADGTYYDALSSKTLKVKNGTAEVTLPPLSFALFVANKPENPHEKGRKSEEKNP